MLQLDRLCDGVNIENNDDIAIIGISCKMPAANNAEEFWNNIITKKNTISSLPKNRKRILEENYKVLYGKPFTGKTLKASYLDDIAGFDYSFFGLNKAEANMMDPTHRIFLQTAYSAFEDAGYTEARIKGSNTGVFVGYSELLSEKYFELIKKFGNEGDIASSSIGNINSVLSSRISYLLDLKGPNMLIDTACSSSLVAIDIGCQYLRKNVCDIALVGGIHLIPFPYESNIKLGIESSDAITKSFDDLSDGTGTGESSIAIIIKKLKKAQQDGDHIYAIIKGTSVNQDGKSISITAPNKESQRRVLISAWENAGINIEDMKYIEAHGTGTAIGDVLEVEALSDAFNYFTDKKQFCAISAAKANIGHTLDVSGLVGVIKAIMALNKKVIPASTNFQFPNRKIRFQDTAVYVNDINREWKTAGQRVCGISSFGISGTNAHIVLQEYDTTKSEEKSFANVLFISAKTMKSLRGIARKYNTFLQNHLETIDVGDFCFTADIYRNIFDLRIAIVFSDVNDLIKKLKMISENEENEWKEENGIAFNEINNNDFGKWNDCIENYLKHGTVSLNKYFVNCKRISIPTYAFDEKECWYKKSDSYTSIVKESVETTLLNILEKELEISDISADSSFSSLGIDSVFIIKIHKAIDSIYPGILQVVDLFKYHNIHELAAYIDSQLICSNEADHDEKDNYNFTTLNNDIAIVGIDAKVGDANSKDEFWNSLLKGKDFIKKFPQSREKDGKEVARAIYGVENPQFVKGAFLEEVDMFDYKRFGITKEEATLMDPNQRLILESVSIALNDAGYTIEDIKGSNMGVFIGFSQDYLCNYGQLIAKYYPDKIGISSLGNIASILAGRIAYIFDLHGPVKVIDTACSSSAVAVNDAVENIHLGNCSAAIVAGIKINLAPIKNDENSIGITSNNYKTKTFDDKADGTGIGEGVGTIIIKPVDDANINNNRIYAIIKGTAINHDGNSYGLTVPNAKAQKDLIIKAWNNAGIPLSNINYMEAHGTGTRLGDPIEIQGITDAISEYTDKKQFCGIGSVKSNIGHLYDAAGIFSIIKLALSLYYGIIPKSINMKFPNRNIHFEKSPVYVQDENMKLDGLKNVYVGMSAFGFSGTNAHIVLQRYTQTNYNNISSTISFHRERCWIEKEERIQKEKFSMENLIKVYKDVLGSSDISSNSDYFASGGDSILAITLTKKLNDIFDISLDVTDVLSNPKIIDLYNMILNMRDNNDRYIIMPVDKRKYYPLSYSQKRMYYVTQLDNMSTAYNISAKVVIEGNLNREKFEEAIKKLINYHESLRTTFSIIDDVVQIVHDEMEADITFYDKYSDNIEKNFIRSFDLEKGPLFRIAVIMIQENKYEILFDMHHIISDFMSISIFIRDFIKIYNGMKLKPLPIHYKDFAIWHNEFLDSAHIAEEIKYWTKELEKTPAEINLPYRKEKDYRNRAGKMSTILDKDFSYKIEEAAKKNGVSVFHVFLAAYFSTLIKNTGDKDLIVGIPVSGRQYPGVEDLLGVFINTLPIRISVSKHTTYRELLELVHSKCVKALANQDVPFELITSELKRMNRGPVNLFNTLFVMQNARVENIEIDGLSAYSEPLDSSTAIYDMHWEVIPDRNSYNINLVYNKDVLYEDEIDIIFKNYFIELNNIINNQSKLFSDQMSLKYERGKEYRYEENSIIEMFERQVTKTSSKVAVKCGLNQLTYLELNSMANSIANHLYKLGVKNNDVVAILTHKSIYTIASILGVLKAGAAYMPIDPIYPEERIRYMLDDSNAKVVICNKDIEIPKNIDCQLIIIDELECSKANKEFSVKHNVDDLLYIIYTSGTTGRPKGIMFKNKGMINLVLHEYINTEIDFEHNVLQFATVCFDVASQEIFSCLLAGGTLHIIDDFEKKDFNVLEKFVISNDIKTIFLPTAYFEFICANTNFLKNIDGITQDIIVAGEALKISGKMSEDLCKSSINLHNHYGPTESHVVTMLTITPNTIKPGIPSIGKPINNVGIYILDESRQRVNIGEVGEIFIAGDCLSAGYINQDELTMQKFIDCPFQNGLMYATGDIANWNKDGTISYIGRKDFQIKRRGYRIELSEIENALMEIEDIREASVVSIGSGEDIKIIAYYVANTELDNEVIKKQLLSILPAYMLPNEFIELDSIPLTVNGKVDRANLPRPQLVSSVSSQDKYNTNSNQIEMKLLEIWKDILGKDNISLTDDFYELGGESLKVAVLAAKIRDKLGVSVPLRKLLGKLTIKQLSTYITVNTTDQDFFVYNENGEKVIFCFPPAVGYGFAFYQLSLQLKNTKLICFNFVEKENRIEYYSKLIKRFVNNQERIIILGYSAGGKLAIEVSEFMRSNGIITDKIILIDSMPLNYTDKYTEQYSKLSQQELIDIFTKNVPDYAAYFNDDQSYDIMKHYMEYYAEKSTVENISTPVNLILVQDKYREKGSIKNEEIIEKWYNYANQIKIKMGYGPHELMLTKDYVIDNSEIIQELINSK